MFLQQIDMDTVNPKDGFIAYLVYFRYSPLQCEASICYLT